MYKEVIFFLFLGLITFHVEAQNKKITYLISSWPLPLDSGFSKWDTYKTIYKITEDTVYKEVYKNEVFLKSKVTKNELSSFILDIWNYDTTRWATIQHSLRGQTHCDTLMEGIVVKYYEKDFEKDFWLTNTCFPDQYKTVLQKLFDLFKYPD